MTKTGLARLLKPFGIRPKEVRVGADTMKKYQMAAVIEAKARYVDKVTDASEDPM
jgi:hypothetical protein